MSPTPAVQELWSELGELDRAIEASIYGARSLAPERSRATTLVELVRGVADPTLSQLLGPVLARILRAQLKHFPENIFWDYDYFAFAVIQEAQAVGRVEPYFEEVAELSANLMELYGRHSTIQFRYVHDFLYGFDWARWVARDPQRAASGPFSLEFLRYTRSRAYELLALIAKNDAKYPTLPSDSARNPFAFSREPAEEVKLYEDLATQKMLPLSAWDPQTTPCWDRDFDQLRAERSQALNIKKVSDQ